MGLDCDMVPICLSSSFLSPSRILRWTQLHQIQPITIHSLQPCNFIQSLQLSHKFDQSPQFWIRRCRGCFIQSCTERIEVSYHQMRMCITNVCEICHSKSYRSMFGYLHDKLYVCVCMREWVSGGRYINTNIIVAKVS